MSDYHYIEHQITEAELDQFERHGYLIVEDALPVELVEQLESKVDAIHQFHLDRAYDPYTESTLTEYHNFFYPNFLKDDPLFIDLLDWPKTFPKVWGILGWNIYSYHSHFIVTPPRLSDANRAPRPLGWHQDSGRVNLEIESTPRPRLSLKIAYWLSDCSQSGRGNFYILPDSHLKNNIEKPTDGTLPKGAMCILAKPGDAVFFDRRLWHARSENDSSITRKALFYGYGYRWLRSKDDMTIPDSLFKTSHPIRQQLLGGGTNANSYFSPKDADVPLKVWLEKQNLIS